MHWGRILIAVIVLSGAGFAIYKWKTRRPTYPEVLQKEMDQQKAELPECKARLMQFYKAWADYRKDHKGAEPGSAQSLLTKYLKSPDLLICPTAARWVKQGKPLEQGAIYLDRRNYPVTYGFRWLASGYARDMKHNGDKALLVSCTSHTEALYCAAYKRHPLPGALSVDRRGELMSELKDMHDLAVRRSGEIAEIEPGD